jgi:hypothetical protein
MFKRSIFKPLTWLLPVPLAFVVGLKSLHHYYPALHIALDGFIYKLLSNPYEDRLSPRELLSCEDAFLSAHRLLKVDGRESNFAKALGFLTGLPSLRYVIRKNTQDARFLCGNTVNAGYVRAGSRCQASIYFISANKGPADQHAIGQVFSEKWSKYVVVDPTFNTLYGCSNVPQAEQEIGAKLIPSSMGELISCVNSGKYIVTINVSGQFYRNRAYESYYLKLGDLLKSFKCFYGHCSLAN